MIKSELKKAMRNQIRELEELRVSALVLAVNAYGDVEREELQAYADHIERAYGELIEALEG